MELKLTRPICFFDLETTGIEVAKDRIVEISIFKVFPNGNKESKTWLVNPTVPIPPQSTAIHGISNEKVANEPTFKELASQVHAMIKDSDLAGFNSDRFDIPLLAEELLRAENDAKFRFVVLDAAVLLEAGWTEIYDRLLFVDAPRPLRYERLAIRSRWSENELVAREAAQMPLDEKRRRADAIVVNDGTPSELRKQLIECLARWNIRCETPIST